MPCYHPLDAYRNGAGEIVFTRPRDEREKLKLPCGQCVGCRLERSRQWAIRCMHEASLFEYNCFITLTYAPEYLPVVSGTDVPTLRLDDFQKFMKRLRKRFSGCEPAPGAGAQEETFPIRFFHCGEYGEKTSRPHYHACLFNFDFPDKYYFRKSPSGSKLYRSPALEELWPFGNSSIGDVSFQSAAYVARYIMKKVNGAESHNHYCIATDLETGELLSRVSEYTTMSRRPGIGSYWFDKFRSDVFPHDFVIVNGRKVRPPRYYDAKLQAVAPFEFEDVQFERYIKAQKYVDHTTPDRLATREAVQLAQLKQLPRKLD